MERIKVINDDDENRFEETVNTYLHAGYKVSSTSCGFVDDASYEYGSVLQAILVKEEAQVIPDSDLKCSFCGASVEDVKHLIKCDNVAICDACVLVSLNVLFEQLPKGGCEKDELVEKGEVIDE